jgi:ABC-type antimicrobial peptide transport system permease subunit
VRAEQIHLPGLSSEATRWDRLLYQALWDQFRLNMARITALERTLGTTANQGGWIVRNVSAQSSATYTVLPDDYYLISANGVGTVTYTLPLPAVGRELWFRSIGSGAESAAANVLNITSTALVTTILPATAGKWALLSGRTDHWFICAAG